MRHKEVAPTDLVFIRHGESEENIAQIQAMNGASSLEIDAIYDRANWKQRLTSKGIEEAVSVRDWLTQEAGGLATFGALYVSPYLRARETAAIISEGTPYEWIIDDRIGEREWGAYGETPHEHREALFPASKNSLDNSIFWARPHGGENIPDVHDRINRFLESLAQRHAKQRVLVVTHGGYMRAVRYSIEQMRPEEYESSLSDPDQEIKNCTVLWYSRTNPQDTADSQPGVIWRRITHPNNDQSHYGGKWVELPQTRTYDSKALRDQLEIEP